MVSRVPLRILDSQRFPGCRCESLIVKGFQGTVVNPYSVNGFQDTDVNPWSVNGFQSTVVNPWSVNGFQGTNVNPWSVNGFQSTVVNPWSVNGFQGTVVNPWSVNGLFVQSKDKKPVPCILILKKYTYIFVLSKLSWDIFDQVLPGAQFVFEEYKHWYEPG